MLAYETLAHTGLVPETSVEAVQRAIEAMPLDRLRAFFAQPAVTRTHDELMRQLASVRTPR